MEELLLLLYYTKDQKKQINFLKILILSDSEITTKRYNRKVVIGTY